MKIINFRRFRLPYAQFNAAILFMVAVAGVFVLTKINLAGTAELTVTSISQLAQWKIWTLITHIFFNSDVFGLIFYILFLFFFGIPLERGMGSWQFVLFYLGSGLVSALLIMLGFLAFGQGIPVIGSSAATMAMVVAFACFNPDSQVQIYFIIPVKAVFLPLISLAIIIVSSIFQAGFIYSLILSTAGFLVGIIFMLIFYKRNYFKYF